ncbi:hypothetical protein TWF281_008386 [Arthrobotrys megalospora]
MSDIKATTEAPSTAAPTVEPTVETTPETKQETVEPTPVDKTEEPAPTDAPESSAAAGENAETPAEVPKEIEPISEGVLETKFLSVIPIFLKKHTFYFSEEAIPEDNLGEYLKKEKTKAGHATYAHATQTGKGLLFYTKTDKTKPSGIIKLDGAEITTSGDKKFTIKSAGHELQLEANTAALRERWVYTLKIKIAEAEGIHAATSETDGFKAALEKLVKPAPVVPPKKEEPVEAKKEGEEAKEETPAEASAPAAAEEEVAESSAATKPEEEKKEEKKRSSSKNRLNRFSFFGKKEEKKDEVKEEQPVAEVKEEATPAPVPEAAVVAPLETAAPTTEEPAPVAPTTEATPEEPKTETSPVTSPKTNRKSFLGGLFAKKKEEKKDSPVVEEEGEVKPSEPVPETEAPAAPAAQEPLPDAGEQPAAVETQEPVKSDTEAESPRERKPSGGIFGSLRRDKSTDGEDKPRRSLSFWKKDKEKKGKEEAQPTAITESEPQAEATTEEPAKTEPSSAAPVIPDVTATESEKKITDLPTAPVVTVGDGSKA